MAHIITSLCLRDGACMLVCPVECIIPGKPENEWPWYFIDPDTCIDCGACIPECPFEAIFIEEEVPSAYEMMAGQERLPFDTKEIIAYNEGDVVDLTPDIQYNYAFFGVDFAGDPQRKLKKGPGYEALKME